MRPFLRRLRQEQSGSASVLVAVSAIPLVLAVGLAIDAASLWRVSDSARAGADAAAAVAALHREADCDAGDVANEASTTEARAAYRAAAGDLPVALTVTCTPAGVAVDARHVAELTIMSYVVHAWTTEIHAESSASRMVSGKGWSRS